MSKLKPNLSRGRGGSLTYLAYLCYINISLLQEVFYVAGSMKDTLTLRLRDTA